MKKLLSGVLSLIMIVTFATPTFAVNFDAVENTKSFIYNGQGEFIASGLNLSSMQKENNISSLNKGEHIIAMPTDDSEIYMILNSDKYLVACSENKYLLCDKIDIDIQNFSNNLENFDLYNVSDYLRNDMQNVILEQNALGNEDFKIELYAPSIIDSDVISLQNDEPLGTRYYSYYYDGVYTNMKDYSVKYSDLSTGMIKKEGTSTVDVAKDFVSLIITSAGGIYEVVNAFGSFAGVAMSAYDLFENAYGEVINGTADDYISTNIIYSRIVKETYAQDLHYSQGSGHKL